MRYDVAKEMEGGPPESLYRERLQTKLKLLGSKAPVVSDDCAAKLHKEMEGVVLRNRHTGADSKPPHAALVRKATVVNG